MVYIFGVDFPWYESSAAYLWQQSICWSFILLSGFCFRLGKRKFRRGLEVFGASVLISGVTLIFMPENRIVFGVLSLLGASMLITALLEKVLYKLKSLFAQSFSYQEKRNPFLGFLFTFSLFLLTKHINLGFLGFGNIYLYSLPEKLYSNWLTTFLGFPHRGFWSTDYFSVFPWIFLFWSGYFLHGIFAKYDLLKYLSPIRIKPLEWLGRHSLVIYMLHQPVIYGVLYILF